MMIIIYLIQLLKNVYTNICKISSHYFKIVLKYEKNKWELKIPLALFGGEMKEKLIEALGNKLDSYKVFIDDVYEEDEGNNHYLRVVVDADFVIDSNLIYEVSKVIDEEIDILDLIEDSYILDIYSKEKGEINE